MTDTKHIAQFWQLVQVCLEELYGFSHERAEREIRRLRPRGGAVSGLGRARDMTYHAQPLHVAGNIAKDDEPMSERVWADYQAILARSVETQAKKENAREAHRKPVQANTQAESLKVVASR